MGKKKLEQHQTCPSSSSREAKSNKSKRKENKKHYGHEYEISSEEIKKFAAQLNALGLYLGAIPGDGNCLFRALGEALNESGHEHAHHRQDVVDFLKAHRDDFEPFMEDDISFDDHLESLAGSGTFGGNDSIVAFARLHNVNVCIHQSDQARWDIVPEGLVRKRTLHIAYHNGEHYSAVLHKSDAGSHKIRIAGPKSKDATSGNAEHVQSDVDNDYTPIQSSERTDHTSQGITTKPVGSSSKATSARRRKELAKQARKRASNTRQRGQSTDPDPLLRDSTDSDEEGKDLSKAITAVRI